MNDLERLCSDFPRSFIKKPERPDVPSEAWMRTEQIREHRRNPY